ncbi:hypothetical protein CHISP_3205 [Chitinispirillum alkaliphilum]|nr:hypothetical protein CHISP_3205 [Chitinispirillum alkaliphilum]
MIKKLDWSHDSIQAYEASGKFSKEENLEVLNELREVIKKHGKIRVFVKLPELAYPELSAILDRLSFAIDHKKDIERIALVSNIEAIDWVSSITGLLTGIEFRNYKLDDEPIARSWIESIHR